MKGPVRSGAVAAKREGAAVSRATVTTTDKDQAVQKALVSVALGLGYGKLYGRDWIKLVGSEAGNVCGMWTSALAPNILQLHVVFTTSRGHNMCSHLSIP